MADFTVYAVIMAGGVGRRLWPLSTSSKPKQFIDIDGQSLLSRTFQRIEPLVPRERILVVTSEAHGELVSKCLPDLPTQNIVEEPVGRNTAPCIGLSAIYSRKHLDLKADSSVMIVLPADHLVKNGSEFRESLSLGSEIAYSEGSYVTLGIEPTEPATGYGYIQAGDSFGDYNSAKEVVSFTEKPDYATAKKFLRSGNYFWNSGTFIWRTDSLLQGFKNYLPKVMVGLEDIENSFGMEGKRDVLERVYGNFESISIDYGLMEKAENTVVIPASFGWSDLGDWPSFELVLSERQGGNNCFGNVYFEDSRNNLAYNQADKPVVLLGMDDLVVVNAQNALLVMRKEKAQQVKQIANKFDQEGGGENDS